MPVAQVRYLSESGKELAEKSPSRLHEDGVESWSLIQHVEINNARELEDAYVFGKHGFQLVKHDPKIDDLADPANSGKYCKEIALKVKELTGAPYVFVSSPLIRDEELEEVDNANEADDGPQGNRAHHMCHNDYTEQHGDFLRALAGSMPDGTDPGNQVEFRRMLLRNNLRPPRGTSIETIEEAVKSPNARIMVINTWRSALPPGSDLEHCPLAVCSAQSVSPSDLARVNLPRYNGIELDLPIPYQICLSAPSPKHEWYFFPKMKHDEVLCFKTFDSAARPLQPPLHTAFLNPETPKDAPKRKSIEVRVTCIWPEGNSRL